MKIKLTLIGEGPKKQDLMKLSGSIEFKGRVPNQDLPIELNKALIFCLPSFYEGCPKALLEAMSCSLPCIGTNTEGIKEIITEENGILVSNDKEGIKKGIKRLLDNKGLRETIAIKARQTIENRFSLNKIIEKELMGGRNKSLIRINSIVEEILGILSEIPSDDSSIEEEDYVVVDQDEDWVSVEQKEIVSGWYEYEVVDMEGETNLNFIDLTM